MRVFSRLGRIGPLSSEAKQVLRLLAAGGTLKAHRGLNGDKAIRLHPLVGPAVEVSDDAMGQLKQRRLIDSNMKFPAATYLLTAQGRRVASSLSDQAALPLSAAQFRLD